MITFDYTGKEAQCTSCGKHNLYAPNGRFFVLCVLPPNSALSMQMTLCADCTEILKAKVAFELKASRP